MILMRQRVRGAVPSIPRESGDDPFRRELEVADSKYSPRERG